MDAHNPRDRMFSILNDNDSPSFVVKSRQPSSVSPKSHAQALVRHERPNLLRHTNFSQRNSSVSSVSSPPLLRFDSTSSKSSRSSMDSSPSPITPAFYANDPAYVHYDNLIRPDLATFVTPTTAITPLLERQMMLAPSVAEQMAQYTVKTPPTLVPNHFPLNPLPATEPVHASSPPSLTASKSMSTSSLSNAESIPDTSATKGSRKNKYPCPYAASHHCPSFFTTSGHAARHGKKHTGEKGVHCPVCNKAFTRKDNMKQHERTHKGGARGGSGAEDRFERLDPKSKAAITRDAVAQKEQEQQLELEASAGPGPVSIQPRPRSLMTSPLANMTALAPSVMAASLRMEEPSTYPPAVNAPQMLIPASLQPPLEPQRHLSPIPMPLYPQLADEVMLVPSTTAAGVQDQPATTQQQEDAMMANLGPIMGAPPLTRDFSDLDTLARVAAGSSFDNASYAYS